MAKKPSFFDRLTGAHFDNEFDTFEDEDEAALKKSPDSGMPMAAHDEPGTAQLTVDVYQNPSEIIIRALVAGVKPEDLDIAITRDMVTIKGHREDSHDFAGDDFFHKELYWGAFSRTIVLPAEVEVEEAEATNKNGLLTLKLPKIDRNK